MIIGQVAAATSVSTRQIRYYEQIGFPISEIANFWRNFRESRHER